MKQNGLTIMAEITGDLQAVERRLRQAQDRLAVVPTLHFLSFFIIDDAKHPPALLMMEANFDGRPDDFLAQLVAANADLLHALYSQCDRYPGRDDAKLRRYLRQADIGSNLFYVGCPGLTVAQIRQESGLAVRVEDAVRDVKKPEFRRSQVVRQVWQSLSSADRDQILKVPPPPFWVRNSLASSPLATIYGFLKKPFFWLGIVTAILILLELILPELFGIHLWRWLAPPRAVVEAALRWARILGWIVAGLSFLWIAAHVVEFPEELTQRTRRYVLGVKAAQFISTTCGAVWDFIALVGVIAWLHWYGWTLGVLALLVLMLAVSACLIGLVWISAIALAELGERVDPMKWNSAKLPARAREDVGKQNHLASVVPIKEGFLRPFTLGAALFAINWLARIVYNPRGLFSTQSIHFARWVILPGRPRRLLFLSNYAGSFGGYLGIFATLGAAGVSAIWSNTDGFPRSFFLFGAGPRDEQRFKCYARESQVETLLWYRAYSDLSVSMIQANNSIRQDLARFSLGQEIYEKDYDKFLRRFSVPNP